MAQENPIGQNRRRVSGIAIIGGTGLARLDGLQPTRKEVARTPYGEPSGPLNYGRFHGREVVFLARHGGNQNIPPHMVNYRANMWAVKQTGASHVIAVAAVGAIAADLAPGSLVIPHQIIDYTYGRKNTYFENDLDEVRHIDFTEPYCAELRDALRAGATAAGIRAAGQGVYAATQGPRLETAAEIDRLERDGCAVVGMTGMPEAALARELGLCYAAVNVVANPAAGRGGDGAIDMDDIRRNLAVGMARARELVGAAIGRMADT